MSKDKLSDLEISSQEAKRKYENKRVTYKVSLNRDKPRERAIADFLLCDDVSNKIKDVVANSKDFKDWKKENKTKDDKL